MYLARKAVYHSQECEFTSIFLGRGLYNVVLTVLWWTPRYSFILQFMLNSAFIHSDFEAGDFGRRVFLADKKTCQINCRDVSPQLLVSPQQSTQPMCVASIHPPHSKFSCFSESSSSFQFLWCEMLQQKTMTPFAGRWWNWGPFGQHHSPYGCREIIHSNLNSY